MGLGVLDVKSKVQEHLRGLEERKHPEGREGRSNKKRIVKLVAFSKKPKAMHLTTTGKGRFAMLREVFAGESQKKGTDTETQKVGPSPKMEGGIRKKKSYDELPQGSNDFHKREEKARGRFAI